MVGWLTKQNQALQGVTLSREIVPAETPYQEMLVESTSSHTSKKASSGVLQPRYFLGRRMMYPKLTAI